MAESKGEISRADSKLQSKEFNSRSVTEENNTVKSDNNETTTDETLSRSNPIAEFLRMQKGNIKDMKEEEFMAKYEQYLKESGQKSSNHSNNNEAKNSKTNSSKIVTNNNNKNNDHVINSNNEGNFKNIVLKFTTLSEGCYEAPSFTVDKKGARIGRDHSNEISVPSDQRLANENHSVIEFARGSFYIIDGGYIYAASVRIGLNNGHSKKWFMDNDARFSAGNSILQSKGIDVDGNLQLHVIEGPLKGENLVITKKGATFGRSSDNTVCIPDRELSRKHSRVDYDEKYQRYTVNDMGSTNGTYVQLVGPYGGKYKLNLNDHILVGRTGFSINRFDYGLSEEMGYRQSMEDACTIVQHLNIGPFNNPDLAPQSFFGVFDGHGGNNASTYLAQHLHINVAHGLLEEAHNVFHVLDRVAPNSIYGGGINHLHSSSDDGHSAGGGTRIESESCLEMLDEIVIPALKTAFLKTDQNFIETSDKPQHGSTATTALILGKRLYCANVGDSRTMICRNFMPITLSEDHKPTREDEAKRIRDAGGFVINNRVMGELAVSRAFGDVDFKKGIQSIIDEEGGSTPGQSPTATNGDGSNWDQPLIIAEPDVQVLTISDDDQFLLLGCDGLFDVYTPEEVVTFVKNGMEKHGDAQRCCQNLTYDAIRKRNSRDNVSVILIILNKWY